MFQTIPEIERLPIEYPLREAIRIYAKRLGVFFAVALVNIGLLLLVLLAQQFLFTLVAISLIIVAITLSVVVVLFIIRLLLKFVVIMAQFVSLFIQPSYALKTRGLEKSPVLFEIADGELKPRIALTWGKSPRDLDLYLRITTSKDVYDIFYAQTGNSESVPWAILNQDIRSGFGPETISLKRWIAGKYHCAVHNCSGETPLAGCGATIEVRYRNQSRTFMCPTNGSGRWWYVFVLDTASGKIETINRISNQPWEMTHERSRRQISGTICPRCGSRVVQNAGFCPRCGFRL